MSTAAKLDCPVNERAQLLGWYQVEGRRHDASFVNVLHPYTAPDELKRHILVVLGFKSNQQVVNNNSNDNVNDNDNNSKSNNNNNSNSNSNNNSNNSNSNSNNNNNNNNNDSDSDSDSDSDNDNDNDNDNILNIWLRPFQFVIIELGWREAFLVHLTSSGHHHHHHHYYYYCYYYYYYYYYY